MVRVLKERKFVKRFNYAVEFIDDEGCGYSFDSDKEGNLHPMTDGQRESYEKCIKMDWKVYGEVRAYSSTFYTPLVIECHCGEELAVDGDTECECGQWYNGLGQELVNPKYWEY